MSVKMNAATGTPKPTGFSLHEYWKLARMHKFPAGSDLIIWPTAFGYVLGAYQTSPSTLEIATVMGAIILGGTLLHCAACVINDICDVEYDRQVERTKTRPLAAGTVSIPAAWIFLILQMAVVFWMMSYMNATAFICGTFGIFPLHAFYPLMKRVTNWPQAWLGLAMNWGLPTAWLMSRPEDYKSQAVWALTFGTFCWTILYDTIYACQDRKDDVKAGVKSTALLFGDYVKPILAIFGSIFVASLAFAGMELQMGLAYFAITVGGCGLHIAWQLLTLDVDDPKDCWNKFAANGYLGYIILGGMMLDWHFA